MFTNVSSIFKKKFPTQNSNAVAASMIVYYFNAGLVSAHRSKETENQI